jgi:DNA repair ATPase RecN
MSLGEMRDVLSGVQNRIRQVEEQVEQCKSTDARYHSVGHELTEAWEALERAIEELDEIFMEVS